MTTRTKLTFSYHHFFFFYVGVVVLHIRIILSCLEESFLITSDYDFSIYYSQLTFFVCNLF